MCAEAPENRLRLLAAILCELLVEMLNQGTLEDVGEARECWVCRPPSSDSCQRADSS